MDTLETVEGTVGARLWFHYDVESDVLYLRLNSKRTKSAAGEEAADGVILLRDKKSRRVVGITIVNWWKRFGKGTLPDSFSEIQKKIKPWGKRIAA